MRFGFNDEAKVWGTNHDLAFYTESRGMDCNERGISFTVPLWTGNAGSVVKIREVLHLSKKKSTFGCALHNCYRTTDQFGADM